LAGIQIHTESDAVSVSAAPLVILDRNIETALSNIPLPRRDQVREFCALRTAQKRSSSSVENYVNAITTLETIGKDYRSITRGEMVAWASVLDEHYAPGTAQLYRILVRNFIKWICCGDAEEAEYPDSVRWIRTKKLKEPYKKHVLSKDDVKRMIRAQNNQRDRALLYCLYEGGCRASEILGLRIKDVTITPTGAEIRVNGKTGYREVPLIESVPDLQLWLNMHPHADDKEYAVWETEDSGRKGMSFGNLYWLVTHTAKKVGLPKGISPHSLRHASATHKSAVLNESQLRMYYGWERDSKMPSKYVHPDKKNLRSSIEKSYGITHEEIEETPIAASPVTCPRCKHTNSPMAKFCMQCGTILDAATAMEVRKLSVEADDITAKVMQELIKRAPDMLRQIVSEISVPQDVRDTGESELTFSTDEVINCRD
jgi:integrase